MRLPTLLCAALRPDADAPPGLPYRKRGMVFGSSLNSFAHGGAVGLDGIRFGLHTASYSLATALAPQVGSSLGHPAQWVSSWSATQGDEQVSLRWDPRSRAYQGGGPGPIVFRGLVPSGTTPALSLPAPHVEHLGPRRELGESDFVPGEPRPVWDVRFTGVDTARVLASLHSFRRTRILEQLCETTRALLDVELRLDEAQGVIPGTTLQGRRSGREAWLPLRELGTGLAHALPVLVALCAATASEPEDAPPNLLTLEEPEAHLHPRVHLALADLLLNTARAGRTRCLVETHSETLILRLQRRVVENPELADIISFVWIDDEGASTLPRALRAEPDGTIPGWPERWFDAAYQESVEISRARLRRPGP